MTFVWGNSSSAGVFECLCPPLPLLSNSAEHLERALNEHPLMRPMHDFRVWLAQHVEHFFTWCEADAHSANDMLAALWRNQDTNAVPGGQPALCNLWHCLNHQTNLIIVSSMDILSMPLITNVVASVRFFKMSGHFLRMIAAARLYLREHLVCIRQPRPAEVQKARAFGQVLADFVVDTWDGDVSTEAGRHAKTRFASAARDCFQNTLLGPTWRSDGKVVVYDTGQRKGQALSVPI